MQADVNLTADPATPDTSGTINIDTAVDTLPFRGGVLLTVVLVGLAIACDGFDLVIVGYVGPALAESFNATSQMIGVVIMLSLVGIAVGGLLGGWLGDRYGRRPIILASIALFGTASGVSALSPDITNFTIWRFICGIGLGAMIPNAISLVAEITPARWRSQSIIAVTMCQPLGGVICGAVAEAAIANGQWRLILWAGALLPALALPILIILLPESPHYLATREKTWGKLVKLLNRLAGEVRYEFGQAFASNQGTKYARGSVRALFARGLAADTFALWAILFTNLFCLVALSYWLPIVLSSAGASPMLAVRSLTVYVATGFLGAIASSYLIPRFGSRLALSTAAFAASAAALAVALAFAVLGLPSSALIFSYAAVAGILITTLHLGCYAVQPRIYPPEIRATGSGWAAALGRIGGIVSSLTGVVITHISAAGFFAILAVSSLLTGIAFLSLSRHIPPASRLQAENDASPAQ